MFKMLSLLLTIGLSILLLMACNSAETVTPQRSFTSVDLLLDGSDLSTEWTVVERRKVPKFEMSESTDDSASGVLTSTTSIFGVSQFIYRYRNISIAKSAYNDSFFPSGQVPSGWDYQATNANESKAGCDGQRYISCRRVARYDEYVVDVYMRITLGELSVEAIEQLIESIDARMISYLKAP